MKQRFLEQKGFKSKVVRGERQGMDNDSLYDVNSSSQNHYRMQNQLPANIHIKKGHSMNTVSAKASERNSENFLKNQLANRHKV